MAQLRGLATAPPASCRVLELGCGAGGNLLPMAATLPDSQFVGVDLSPQQIALAEQGARAAKLTNIQFAARDLLDFEPSAEPFDYIICHGVFSWTTEAVRSRILAVCREWLAPRGLACVNYNTYPGWHMQAIVRDAIGLAARHLSDPAARVRAARQTVELLLATLPAEGIFSGWFRTELEAARRHSDAYLFHAYLNAVNEPFYLRDVAARAGQQGLQYLGDAEPGTMWPGALAPGDVQLRAALTALGAPAGCDDVAASAADFRGGALMYEQFHDFVEFRSTRRSLFCHADRVLSDFPTLDFTGLHLSAHLRRQLSPATGGTTWVAANGRSITADEPRLLRLLEQLAEAWPESRSWEWLTGQAGSSQPAPSPAVGWPEPWRDNLVRCFALGTIELSVLPTPCSSGVSERPQASPLARHQAQQQPLVTNLRHVAIRLEPWDREILRQLDGTRTINQIERAIQSSGNGADTTTAIARSLRHLAAQALLLAVPAPAASPA